LVWVTTGGRQRLSAFHFGQNFRYDEVSNLMKAFIVIILLAVAGYLGYRIMTKPKPSDGPIVETAPAIEETSAPPALVESQAARTNLAAPKLVNTNNPMVSNLPPKGEWKPKMETILGSNMSAQQKLQSLKELFSRLHEAEAEPAVQELTARVTDEGYAFLKPLTVDPTLPEPVRDEFMVDLMNRPNSVKIPLFLEVARNPDHPDRESAFDTLEAFTGLKHGADWNSWEKGIQEWMKENPDRPRRGQTPAVEANQ
jgi:hypothetical protein